MSKSTKIYYFSGTGNSLSIAKDLRSELQNAELMSVARLMRSHDEIVIEGEVIGFVFPVYFGRVPVILEEFLNRAIFRRTDYLFAVANGGGAFCRTLRVLDKQLKSQNRSLNAGFAIGMPGVHPKVNSFIKKTNEQFFSEKSDRLREVTDVIQRRKDHPIETNFGILGFLLSHVLLKSPYNASRKHSLDSALWTTDACVKCGTCQSVCPVQNIELTESGPNWLGKCVNCCRCYHLCPSEAIQLGNDSMQRYRNPDVVLEELI